MYRETDRTLNLTIGPSPIANIDDVTKQMSSRKMSVGDKDTYRLWTYPAAALYPLTV